MPYEFTCPKCGARTDVDESFVGKRGPCAHCGQLVTIAGAAVRRMAFSSFRLSRVVLSVAILVILGLVIVFLTAWLYWLGVATAPIL